MEFLQPVVVGDRLAHAGRRHASSAAPRSRRGVGRGAFVRSETDVRRTTAASRSPASRERSIATTPRPSPHRPQRTATGVRRSWTGRFSVGGRTSRQARNWWRSSFRSRSTDLSWQRGDPRFQLPVHHNPEFARVTGAPDAYANTMFPAEHVGARSARVHPVGGPVARADGHADAHVHGGWRDRRGARSGPPDVAATNRRARRDRDLVRGERRDHGGAWECGGHAPRRSLELPRVRRESSSALGSRWVAERGRTAANNSTDLSVGNQRRRVMEAEQICRRRHDRAATDRHPRRGRARAALEPSPGLERDHR